MVPCLLFPFSLWGNEAKYSLTPSRLSSDKGWLANFEEFFSLGQKLLYYGACLRWWARNMPLPRLTMGVKIWPKVFLTNQCNKRPLHWKYKIMKNCEFFLMFNRIPRTANAPKSFIVLQFLWKEPAHFESCFRGNSLYEHILKSVMVYHVL